MIPLFRQEGQHSWNTWLLEDLQFYYGQLGVGWKPDVLFQAYTSGYLVLFPRLLALLAQAVPVGRAAEFHALAGTVVGALLAWFTYYTTKGWISSWPVRLALASLVVLMPAAGAENTATTVNTIWAFAAVAPWAIVSLQERNRDIVVRCLVVFFAATGMPLPFIFAPLALAWAIYRKTKAAIVVAVAFGVGLLLQGAVMWVSKSDPLGPIQRPASEVAQLVTTRAFGVYLEGSRGALALWRDHGLTPGVISAVVLTAIFGVALIGAGRRAQLLGTIFYAYGIGSVLLLVWWRGTTPWRFRGAAFDVGYQMRYSVPSTLLIASAFAVVLAPKAAAARGRLIARIGRPLFIAQIALVTVLSFSATNYRSVEDRWSVSLAATREKCVSTPPPPVVSATQDPAIAAFVALCRKLGE